MSVVVHVDFTPDPATKKRLADMLYARACAIDDSDPEEGIRLYRRAIYFDPLLDRAMTNVGVLYFRAGDMKLAESWWTRAVRTNPRAADAHYNLGYLCLRDKDCRSAIAHFEMSIGAEPRYANAYYHLAETLTKLGRRSEARACWRKHIELRGDFVEKASKELGFRVIRGGKTKEAHV
jgi:tetratricopeptide (TPR) repeat protein